MKHYTLVLLSLMVPSCTTAYAEMYGTGGVGASVITQLPPDGTWHQDGLPDQQINKTALAYKGGVGYRWSRIYIEANYVKFGSYNTEGSWVPDADYDPVNHQVLTDCHADHAVMRSQTQVGELIAGYAYPLYDVVRLRAHGGVFAGQHHIQAWVDHTPGVKTTFTGLQAGVAYGGGVCLGDTWQVCGDVSVYKTVTETRFAVSKEAVVPMLTVTIPLGGL